LELPERLFNLIDAMNERKDILLKLVSEDYLSQYSISEVHTINLIGSIWQPNVTKIAAELSMTRGGISKTVKRLMACGVITSYQTETNQKEIYYKLTEKGKTVFEAHCRRHAITRQRDKYYFSQIPEEEINKIIQFFSNYNKYLELLIDEVKDDETYV
jgi:DNA-binding MarR family transcriptional regulator